MDVHDRIMAQTMTMCVEVLDNRISTRPVALQQPWFQGLAVLKLWCFSLEGHSWHWEEFIDVNCHSALHRHCSGVSGLLVLF
jgi:hypothetical protein